MYDSFRRTEVRLRLRARMRIRIRMFTPIRMFTLTDTETDTNTDIDVCGYGCDTKTETDTSGYGYKYVYVYGYSAKNTACPNAGMPIPIAFRIDRQIADGQTNGQSDFIIHAIPNAPPPSTRTCGTSGMEWPMDASFIREKRKIQIRTYVYGYGWRYEYGYGYKYSYVYGYVYVYTYVRPCLLKYGIPNPFQNPHFGHIRRLWDGMADGCLIHPREATNASEYV